MSVRIQRQVRHFDRAFWGGWETRSQETAAALSAMGCSVSVPAERHGPMSPREEFPPEGTRVFLFDNRDTSAFWRLAPIAVAW